MQRPPCPALAPFVVALWHGESRGAAQREHALPSGAMHVVLRLSGPAVRVYTAGGGDDLGYTLIGGARSAYYVKDVSEASCSIGAVLQPGGSLALLGTPASEFAETHTDLADVWGREAEDLRWRIMEASAPVPRLRIFEAALLARLRPVAIHPAVDGALETFRHSSDVAAAVAASGYSHRRFNQLFRAAVGLTPKIYCRVQRFQRTLRAMGCGASWIDLALDSGYSDQAHFCREFQAFAGVTPTEYARILPADANHLPRSNSFNTRRGA
ncbi:MAG: AraC family transcriptional regulator [Bryobacterales bacterium]|nr:AraC family transcriptional regulator [Bryobacterales bacterium]